MYLILFLTSFALSFLTSNLIDRLYRLPNAPLTFPDSLQGHHIFRKIFLTSIFFSVFSYCSQMTFSLFFFYSTAVFFLSLISITDFEQYVIFDVVLIPFAFFGILFSLLFELPLLERFVSSICSATFFFALMFISKNGIGGGDVKLVSTLALWLGAEKLISTVLTASILGGVFALLLLLFRIKRHTDFFAYGPYFCIAAAFFLFQ